MSNNQQITISDEVKEFLKSNHKLLINGEWTPSSSNEKIEVFDTIDIVLLTFIIEIIISFFNNLTLNN